jgi:hypothetical protein
MHDWVGVASDGSAAIFRIAEEAGFRLRGAANQSKDCQMRRAGPHRAAALRGLAPVVAWQSVSTLP